MATFNSDLVSKGIRHRGLYSGKEQTLAGRIRVAAGGSIATTDLMQMVPLGENTRPIRITALVKPVSGTPVLTNPSFSFGIKSIAATNYTRVDGTVFTPVTTSATRLGASTALTTDEMAQITEVDTVADVADWAPFYVTMTPSGAGAFSVAGGDVDVVLEVAFLGETKEPLPIYTEFNNTKYKN
jgi:hypothetical protein